MIALVGLLLFFGGAIVPIVRYGKDPLSPAIELLRRVAIGLSAILYLIGQLLCGDACAPIEDWA